MAKKKKETIIDLKPKAEKISEEELKNVQEVINNINRAQLEIGSLESRKHHMLHSIAGLNEQLTKLQKVFEEQYGSSDINVQTGEIKYPEDNGETN